MRGQYHVNDDGEFGPCGADKKCPFELNAGHFDKIEDARIAAENFNKRNNNQWPEISKIEDALISSSSNYSNSDSTVENYWDENDDEHWHVNDAGDVGSCRERDVPSCIFTKNCGHFANPELAKQAALNWLQSRGSNHIPELMGETAKQARERKAAEKTQRDMEDTEHEKRYQEYLRKVANGEIKEDKPKYQPWNDDDFYTSIVPIVP